jgi:hypothetical protein
MSFILLAANQHGFSLALILLLYFITGLSCEPAKVLSHFSVSKSVSCSELSSKDEATGCLALLAK